ncbi:ThuA domain-containing protein [Novosphingobium piscinae]|uniref:ThuA domain-containing protein n=1 Tax=Novosphingobium piscinae TaxID=1507448 RepID=A0A7X1FZ35_9SPHN|nr:ThuA domain-containing protein [Novosphingobium piscinae]MBC2669002.1 ThuA domain-containing protein [Novosphingobium piscinae]
MPIIRHRAPVQCLVAVRGHPFDRTAFDAMFQAMEGIAATMVDQPAAALLMNPEAMRGFDALVLYDMPGLDFEAPQHAPQYRDPSPALQAGFRALLEAGKGVVALHHALAGWPTWAEYHDWLGGQFFYRPGRFAGTDWPDSGYRHEVTHDIAVAPGHPVTAGLPASFTLTDELYLCPMLPEGAVPLLHSSARFADDAFWSAELAVKGEMFSNTGWHHPPGAGVIGWAKQALASRLVYLQPGDGPSAYDSPDYRRLVENAIRWVAEARPDT